MEDRLESYRLRKRRTETVKSVKDKLFEMLSINTSEKSETTVKIEVMMLELSIMKSEF